MLGQRRYGANIDYGLAARVNREVEEENRRKRLEKKNNSQEKMISSDENNGKLTSKKDYYGNIYLTLHDISCFDADNQKFEDYEVLQVKMDVERKVKKSFMVRSCS